MLFHLLRDLRTYLQKEKKKKKKTDTGQLDSYTTNVIQNIFVHLCRFLLSIFHYSICENECYLLHTYSNSNLTKNFTTSQLFQRMDQNMCVDTSYRTFRNKQDKKFKRSEARCPMSEGGSNKS